jgi:hypothetical protein
VASHYNKLGLDFATAVRIAITGREAHLHVYAVHQIISWEVLLAVVTVKTVVVVLICMPCVVVVNAKYLITFGTLNFFTGVGVHKSFIHCVLQFNMFCQFI